MIEGAPCRVVRDDGKNVVLSYDPPGDAVSHPFVQKRLNGLQTGGQSFANYSVHLSWMRFCGLTIADPVPDANIPWDFREATFGCESHIGLDARHRFTRRQVITNAAAHDGARLREGLFGLFAPVPDGMTTSFNSPMRKR